ncbi:unnamed protein product [Candidula unifasciata]|uniref:Uncharacterized protein n=1 Tax=Candidula unifasciata TaxID=100452 RepID=A0A8S3ZVR0_9EUPU|nr:unnamed protein product [Candidula unifasciata]
MVSSKGTHASILLALLLLALVQSSLCQNYHFSNGWYPGKKRSASPSSAVGDSGTSSTRSASSYVVPYEDSCTLSPEAVMIINRIVLNEVARMQRSCNSEASTGLTDILENAAGKLEPDGKW